jgi:hypothetical protein
VTIDEAIRKLDGLADGDPESAHGWADGVLLEMVPEEVRAAYQRASQRIGFWYA